MSSTNPGQQEAQLQVLVQEQIPVPVQPPLYDMDLEHIHTLLYKNWYLTPAEFLSDVQKILHNATVRGEEDQERMWKVQAMYTAAEVSILEFDVLLRDESEGVKRRVKEWERKARQLDEKEKEKQKELEKEGQGQGEGTRKMKVSLLNWVSQT